MGQGRINYPSPNYKLFILLLLAVPLTYFLMLQQQDLRQRAQQTTPIYLVPDKETVNQGETLAIALQLKTDVAPVKEVQVNLNYPQEKLSEPDISYSNSPFNETNEQIIGQGLVRIGRNAVIPVAGYNQIASLQFTARQPISLQEISLAPGSYVVSDQDKSLPVSLVVVNSSYYQSNQPLQIKPLETFFDILISIQNTLAERFPIFASK